MHAVKVRRVKSALVLLPALGANSAPSLEKSSGFVAAQQLPINATRLTHPVLRVAPITFGSVTWAFKKIMK